MDVKNLLAEEIKTELNSLEDLEFGGQEHKVAVDTVGRLLDKYNELEKMDLEHQDKLANRMMEQDLKAIQMKEERRDRIVKNCLTATSVVSGIVLTVWGTFKTLKFEETGTVTTMAGRNFISNLFHKK